MKKLVLRIAAKIKNKSFFWVIAIIIVIILFMPFKKVEVGERAIIFNSIKGEPSRSVSSGWHFVVPFVHTMTVYPLNDQTYKIYRDNENWNDGIDASIIAPTNDNQKVSIDATFIYCINTQNLEYIFERFNGEDIKNIEENYLDDIFKNAVVSITSKYSAYEVYSTKREEIQNKILATIKEQVMENGVELKYVYIDTVRLSEEAESIIKAQALAEAAIIEAQGKSNANKILSESLSDKIMTYEALSQLSESLKLVVVPSGIGSEIDFSKLLEQILEQTESASE